MTTDIQQQVDELAHRMKRSVAVDDHSMRLLASSEHFEDVDEVRLSSLIGRAVHGEALEYVLGLGLSTWRTPRRLPANRDLGIAHDRFCFPLWSGAELLGFMWLIDDGELTDSEVAVASTAAESIRSTLEVRSALRTPLDVRLAELTLQVLTGTPDEATQALDGLRGLDVDVDAPRNVLRVQGPHGDGFAQSPDTVRTAVSGLARDAQFPSLLHCVESEDLVLVVGGDPHAAPSALYHVAQAVRHHVAASLTDGAEFVVGVGDPVSGLGGIRRSARQASTACRIARASDSAVAVWAADPVDASIARLVGPGVTWTDVPEPVHHLLVEDPEMCNFLTVHLDGGCVVATTAAQLFLHRGTVYYRLERLREQTGLDLRDGRTRLLLHLWLAARPHLDSTAGDTDSS